MLAAAPVATAAPTSAKPSAADDLAQRARRVAEVAARHADAVDRDGRFPEEAIATAKSEKLMGLMIPAALGGEGRPLVDVATVCGILGEACSSAGMVYAMHQIKVSSLVTHGIESAWHRGFMRRVAAEQLLLASATTEGGVGGDLRNSLCAVERDGDTFRLGKDATVISYGKQADAILITARRAPDAPSSDQVLVAITRDQYTLDQTTSWDTLGMRGTCSVGFRLESQGAVEQIFPQPFAEIAAQSMLAMTHIFWGALWQGIAAGALSKAQAFVRAEARRRPDIVPPGATRVVEAASQLHSLRSLVLSSIHRYEEAARDQDALSAMGFAVGMNTLKLTSSQQSLAIVQQALMVTGIAGYRNDTPFSVARPLRDILSAQLMINNDRIVGNTAAMLLVSKLDTSLEG